jgi:hypothetical protein
MDVSLEYFFRLRREVGIARNELIGDGQRNTTLEEIYNLIWNN